MKALGIDLSGFEKRPTGVAYIEDEKIKCSVLYKDEEIIELSKAFSHVFVDAPLSLPKGRKNIKRLFQKSLIGTSPQPLRELTLPSPCSTPLSGEDSLKNREEEGYLQDL